MLKLVENIRRKVIVGKGRSQVNKEIKPGFNLAFSQEIRLTAL